MKCLLNLQFWIKADGNNLLSFVSMATCQPNKQQVAVDEGLRGQLTPVYGRVSEPKVRGFLFCTLLRKKSEFNS